MAITKAELIELMTEYVGFPPDSVPRWVDYELAADAILDRINEEFPKVGLNKMAKLKVLDFKTVSPLYEMERDGIKP